MSNLTAFGCPRPAASAALAAAGAVISGRSDGAGVGAPKRFGHRIAVLQRHREIAADRDRVLEGGAELALVVGRIDARIDAWRDWARRPRPRRRRNPAPAGCRQRLVRPVAVRRRGARLRSAPSLASQSLASGCFTTTRAGTVRFVGAVDGEFVGVGQAGQAQRLGRLGAGERRRIEQQRIAERGAFPRA